MVWEKTGNEGAQEFNLILGVEITGGQACGVIVIDERSGELGLMVPRLPLTLVKLRMRLSVCGRVFGV